MRRRLLLVVLIGLLLMVPGAHAQEPGRGLDVVIILDTSGPLLDQFDALCRNFTRDVAALQARGFDLRVTLLAVAKPYACATDTAQALDKSAVASEGDWGAAVVAVADKFAWRANTVRLIVPLSNRGPALGDPVDDPGADRDVVARAIRSAQQRQISVSPVLGAADRTTQPQDRSRLERLAADLATATNGQLTLLPAGETDPSSAVFGVIGEAAQAAEAGPMLSIPGAVTTLTCQRDIAKCVSFDPAVLITNLAIAAIFTLILGFANELLYNSWAALRGPRRAPLPDGIDTSRWAKARGKVSGAIEQTSTRATGMVRAVFAPETWSIGTPLVRRALSTVFFVVTVGVVALFAAFVDPEFRPGSPRGVAIYLSLFAAIGLVNLIYARTQVSGARRLGHTASLRVRPLSVVIMLLGAGLSRSIDFLPGLLIATVGGYALTTLKAEDAAPDKTPRRTEAQLSAEVQRRMVGAGLIAVLAVGIAAWLLAIPVDLLIGSALAQPETQALTLGLTGLGALASVLLTIYVIALLLVFFGLTPLRLAAGHRLFAGSRVLWALAFGVTTFIVLETMINPRTSGLDVFGNSVLLVLAALVAVISGVALALWLSVNDRQMAQDAPATKNALLTVLVLLGSWFVLGGCGLLAFLARTVNVSTILLIAAGVVALVTGIVIVLRLRK